MSVPALRRLRQAFPSASITLHTRSWAEGVFQDADFIDKILLIDDGGSRVGSVIAQTAALRRERFDLALLFPNSFESALVARLANISQSIGYAGEGRGRFLTHAIPRPEWKDTRHEAFYYLNLADTASKRFGGLDVTGSTPDAWLPVSAIRQQKAREFLADHGIDLSRRRIAIAAGSKNSRAKRWLPESYTLLADRFASELSANIVLVGASDETEISALVAQQANASLIDLTGKTNLAEAAAVLSVCDLLVANDMGLAHLASAAGTPTVVIFGPTNHLTTAPFGSNAAVARVDVECSPCMLRDCPIDHRCMTRLSVDDVFQKAARMIDSTGI